MEDTLVKDFDLGLYCSMREINQHTAMLEGLNYFYNREIVESYINSLMVNNHSPNLRIYSKGNYMHYVGFLKENKNGILKAILQVNDLEQPKLFLFVVNGTMLDVIQRDIKYISTKTGLTKPSKLTREIMLKPKQTIKEVAGTKWAIPKEWYRELGMI